MHKIKSDSKRFAQFFLRKFNYVKLNTNMRCSCVHSILSYTHFSAKIDFFFHQNLTNEFIFIPSVVQCAHCSLCNCTNSETQVQGHNFEQLIIGKLCVMPKINTTISFGTHHIWT